MWDLIHAIVDKEYRTKEPRFRVDFVTKLSYLAARPSLAPRPFQVFVPFFFFFLPDRPTHPHEREGDGKRNIKLGWPKMAAIL